MPVALRQRPGRLLTGLAASAIAASAPAQPPMPAVFVHNPSGVAQDRTLSVAWPLPRHWGVTTLRAVRVGDVGAECQPRLRWPDQTLAVVELRFRVRLAAGERAIWQVEGDYERGSPLPDVQADTRAWPAVHSVVVDPWGRSHRALLRACAATPGAIASATAWHRADDGESGLLAAHVFWQRYGDNPERVLTVVLDNGRWHDHALGPVRLQAWRVACDEGVELLPVDTRGLQRVDEDGAVAVLGPSQWLYLGDATAKVARFHVVPKGLPAAQRAELAATLTDPAYALPELNWLRWCGTYGLHGGPAPRLGALDDLSMSVLGRFYERAEFGPFGAYGDDKSAVALGSSRHGDSALHNVLRFPSMSLLTIASGAVGQGALRPPPGHSLRLPAVTEGWRAGLSQRAMAAPHGYQPFDYEHVAFDVASELYWLTGDPVAWWELRTAGRAVRDLLGRLPFMTCRGEAVCMRALTSIAWVTADRELLDFVNDRALRVVAAKLREHPVAVIAQPPHREGIGADVWFDAPWQMAMLLSSLCALHRLEPTPGLVDMIETIASRLVGPCWLDGVGPKYLVAARDANRFLLPRAYAPLDGTAHFHLGALVLAGEVVRDDALRARLRARALEIVAATRGRLSDLSPRHRADPWFQVWLDREGVR